MDFWGLSFTTFSEETARTISVPPPEPTQTQKASRLGRPKLICVDFIPRQRRHSHLREIPSTSHPESGDSPPPDPQTGTAASIPAWPTWETTFAPCRESSP